MKMKMQELLTRGAWEALTTKFGESYGTDSAIYIFLNTYDTDLQLFALNDFADLLTIDFPEEYNNETIALMAFMHMGVAFKRIFDVLTTDYDPLENFFTDGTFEKKGEVTVEKQGTETTSPSGKIKKTREGQSYSEAEGSFSVGQGSTYDSASTTPPSTDGAANDFYNISRDINHNKVKNVMGDANGGNLPKETIEYDNHKVEKSFEGRKDVTHYDDAVDETHKRGNSGIFSKQDLIQREVRLRLKNRILPIYVRMVVDTFSTGVWAE